MWNLASGNIERRSDIYCFKALLHRLQCRMQRWLQTRGVNLCVSGVKATNPQWYNFVLLTLLIGCCNFRQVYEFGIIAATSVTADCDRFTINPNRFSWLSRREIVNGNSNFFNPLLRFSIHKQTCFTTCKNWGISQISHFCSFMCVCVCMWFSAASILFPWIFPIYRKRLETVC